MPHPQNVLLVPVRGEINAMAHCIHTKTLRIVSYNHMVEYFDVSCDLFKSLRHNFKLILELVKYREGVISSKSDFNSFNEALNQGLKNREFTIDDQFVACFKCTHLNISVLSFDRDNLIIRETCRSGVSYDYQYLDTDAEEFFNIFNDVLFGDYQTFIYNVSRKFFRTLTTKECLAFNAKLQSSLSKVMLSVNF